MWQGTTGDGHNKYTVGVEATGEHLGNTAGTYLGWWDGESKTEHDVQEIRDLTK